MAVLQGIVLNDNARSLDVRGFEVSEQAMLVTGVGRNTVVANQWLCEDEDLATVGWVGHRFGVTDKRSGKDGFSGDVGLGSERLAFEDGSVLNSCQ